MTYITPNPNRSCMQPFDYAGLHFESSGTIPERLISFFHNFPVGIVSATNAQRLSKKKKKWIAINPANSSQPKTFRISLKDYKLVKEHACNLLALMDVDFSNADEPLKILDRHLQDIGIDIAFLKEMEEGVIKNAAPRRLFYSLKNICRLKIFVKNFPIKNEEKDFKDFMCGRLGSIEIRMCKILMIAPGAKILVPDIIPVSPIGFSSMAVSINYQIEEKLKDYSKKELRHLEAKGIVSAKEKCRLLGVLEAKLMEESMLSDKECRIKKSDSNRVLKNASGCVDFAFVSNEIGAALLSDGRSEGPLFRPDICPFLEKIWAEFFKNFCNKVQNRDFAFADEAAKFITVCVLEVNSILKKADMGSPSLSFVWTIQTLHGTKFALILNIGKSGIVLYKNDQFKARTSYIFFQPDPEVKFGKGKKIDPQIVIEEIQAGDVICLFSDGIAGQFSKKEHLASFLDISGEEGNFAAMAQQKIDLIKSGRIPIEKTARVEEASSVRELKGLRDTRTFDDLSLVFMEIK